MDVQLDKGATVRIIDSGANVDANAWKRSLIGHEVEVLEVRNHRGGQKIARVDDPIFGEWVWFAEDCLEVLGEKGEEVLTTGANVA